MVQIISIRPESTADTQQFEKAALGLLQSINERSIAMAKSLDEMLAQGQEILAQVTKNTDLDASIIAITNAYAAQLADLKAQLVAAGIDKEKLAQLADAMQALADKAAAEGQLVADAVTANT